MSQSAVPWTSLPPLAWNVLEHLEMSLLFEDTGFRLKSGRWYSVSLDSPLGDVSNQSYAQSTMKGLIEAGVLELKVIDGSSFLTLTERGLATLKNPPPDEVRGFL